jgi:hypothetical protein
MPNNIEEQIISNFESSLPRSTLSILLKNNIGKLNSNKPLTKYNFEIIEEPKDETTSDSETFSPTMAPQKINDRRNVVWEILFIKAF